MINKMRPSGLVISDKVVRRSLQLLSNSTGLSLVFRPIVTVLNSTINLSKILAY